MKSGHAPWRHDVFTHTHPDSGLQQTYRNSAGQQPLPGYTLLEPLGKGGFGEVWKCEAPGGLHKAIKFVTNSAEGSAANSLEVEYEAFQHIKTIRHPFLLNLERVELLGDELVMVMELADQQLQDRFRAYTHQGQVGIPRDELLGYLADAAEMLDHISSRHGLQHLDIKPANLFLVCERVKVGDFGLVRQHELVPNRLSADRGLTPRYVAPEILHGRVDPRSDQYCLALVYQELLTGVFPYNARSAQQMMLQHASAAPNLAPLPLGDRYPVGKALAKAPTDRYPSCLEFIRALLTGDTGHDTLDQAHETWGSGAGRGTNFEVRQARMNRSSLEFELPAAPTGAGLDPSALTGRMSQPPIGGRLPHLTTQNRQTIITPRKTVPTLHGNPRPVEEPIELVSLTPAAQPIRLQRIWSVLPADRLKLANPKEFVAPDAKTLIETMVMAAAPDGEVPKSAGVPQRERDGTWTSRFPVRVISGVAKIKLELLKESWKAEVEPAGPDQFFIRRHNTGGFWDRMNGKKNGLIVHLKLPAPGSPVGEAVLTGSLFGPPDPALTRAAEELLPQMLDEVRGVLGTTEDRRKQVRVPCQWAVTLYPLTSDGLVGRPIAARLRDLSIGGLCGTAPTPIETAYVYVVFQDVPAAANWAQLTRLTRSTADVVGFNFAGRFRTDL